MYRGVLPFFLSTIRDKSVHERVLSGLSTSADGAAALAEITFSLKSANFLTYRPFALNASAIFSYHVSRICGQGVDKMTRIVRRRRGSCIFPGYRWCGPHCSGPGRPTNEPDACCMHHDLCLKSGRRSPYECDQAFIRCLRPHINRHTLEGRQALLMSGAIKLRSGFQARRRY